MRANAILSRTVEEQRIDDVEASPQQDVLTSPWSPTHRLLRSPALSPAHTIQDPSSSLDAVIQSKQSQQINSLSAQNVPQLSDASPQPSLSSSSPLYRNVLTGQSLGSSQLPSASRVYSNYGSLNNSSLGLRTAPVFESTSQLAAHYGIPRKLPPLPRVNSVHNTVKPPVPLFNQAESSVQPRPEPSPSATTADFQALMSNYLAMISRNPEDTQNVDQSPAQVSAPLMEDSARPMDDAMQSLVDVLCSESYVFSEAVFTNMVSDADVSGPEWNDYLTSPYDESPFEKLLDTPALGTNDLGDFYTSPVVATADTSLQSNHQDLQLFASVPEANPTESNDKMGASTMPPPQTTPSNFDGLYTMSPYTPSLDPLSLNSPALLDSPGTPASLNGSLPRRPKQPTGTRKGVTPETLVPLDAPTQPRNYNGPSTTARKELPAVFARKRVRAVLDEEDELQDEMLSAPVSNTEEQAIIAKRRQNTLAARRSRKRKLEYQQHLEDEVERQRAEIEMWKTRAMMYQEHLRALGLSLPMGDNTA